MRTQNQKDQIKKATANCHARAPDTDGLISIYSSHEGADSAFKKLQSNGFDIKKLSIIGRGFHGENDLAGFYNMGDEIKYWGKFGIFWGGLWGLLFGSALVLIPGFGPVAVAGFFTSSFIGAVEGAASLGVISALSAAFLDVGIPKDKIMNYETAIKDGKYLMIVHGTYIDIEKALSLVGATGAHTLTNYKPLKNLMN
jgi:hypothetical protein